MIKLYQFPNPTEILNPSPFCMKVEVYCKLAGVPYEIIKTPDPRKAPKGKLPYIEDGKKRIADSTFIIDYLENKKHSKISFSLSREDSADYNAYKIMMEEHLYWAIYYSRWVDDRGWKIVKHGFFKNLPFPFKLIVPELIRKKCIAQIKEQGLGRHSADEIYDMGIEDLKSLSGLLGKKDFFFGDKPHLFDCSAYAFLESVFWGPWETPMKMFAEKEKTLLAYAQRVKKLL